jgi:hypothetical protein
MADFDPAVSKCIVPDLGCSTSPPGYVDWQVRQPYAGVDYIPPVRDYECGRITLKKLTQMTEGGNYNE